MSGALDRGDLLEFIAPGGTGIPSSPSHALIGGIVGAGDREAGRGRAGGRRRAEDRGLLSSCPAAARLRASARCRWWRWRATWRASPPCGWTNWFRRARSWSSAGSSSLGHGGKRRAERRSASSGCCRCAAGYSPAGDVDAAEPGPSGCCYIAIGIRYAVSAAGASSGDDGHLKLTKLKPVGRLLRRDGRAPLRCSSPPALRHPGRRTTHTTSPGPSPGRPSAGAARRVRCAKATGSNIVWPDLHDPGLGLRRGDLLLRSAWRDVRPASCGRLPAQRGTEEALAGEGHGTSAPWRRAGASAAPITPPTGAAINRHAVVEAVVPAFVRRQRGDDRRASPPTARRSKRPKQPRQPVVLAERQGALHDQAGAPPAKCNTPAPGPWSRGGRSGAARATRRARSGAGASCGASGPVRAGSQLAADRCGPAERAP